MKKFVILFCSLCSVSAVFAQTIEPEGATSASELIIHNENYFSIYDYHLYDGTPLKYGKLRSMLKSVPENEKLMKAELGIRIANYSFAAIAAASLITGAVYYNNTEWENSDTIINAAIITGLFSFLGELFTYQAWEDKFERAVGNYNLKIMGIPIPVDKK
ncbi:MAG: hypothetical protein LBH18_02830 [Spirochaetaceae bacterium]|jgi:hypothetical protein|nr:hypothetical protein [Spirochaetaceae bacterium]